MISATCELWIDGARINDGRLGTNSGAAPQINQATNPTPASATSWSSNATAKWALTFASGSISVNRSATADSGVAASLYATGLNPSNPTLPAGVRYQRSVEIWVDAAGSVASGGPGAYVGGQALPAGVWTRVVEQFEGTGVAQWVSSLTVLIPGVGTGIHVKLRRAQLIANPTGATLPYFDGATPDVAGVIDYKWNGTANASASTATDIRPVRGDTVAISGLRIDWGRQTVVDQPSPSQLTFDLLDREGGNGFDSLVHLGSTVVVWSAHGADRRPVFAGRVSDLDASYDDDSDGAVCSVIVADVLADLANRYVGSEPWAAQYAYARVEKILAAIGNPYAYSMSTALDSAWLVLSRMDVDRQASQGLLYDVAVSSGTVLWSSIDAAGKPVLKYEDPSTRPSQSRFLPSGTPPLWRPTIGGAGAGVTPLDACQVLRDPVQWSRTVTDLLTRVTVRWLDQAGTGATTERSISTVNTSAETTYGARGLSVGTILTSQTDAQARITALMAATAPSDDWRATGLTIDCDITVDESSADAVKLVMDLLGAATRGGYAIMLGSLPWWTPTDAAAQLFVEGGQYSFDEGRWIMALNTTPAAGTGATLTLAQVDRTVRYVDVDPAVRYVDMVGVGP